MKILVTGAKGFVGKNLCAQLNNIKDGKARCYGDVTVEAVYEYDIDSKPEELDTWCKDCDFVFNLAGVNRPQNQVYQGFYPQLIVAFATTNGYRMCSYDQQMVDYDVFFI